jgi:hypothetical protein
MELSADHADVTEMSTEPCRGLKVLLCLIDVSSALYRVCNVKDISGINLLIYILFPSAKCFLYVHFKDIRNQLLFQNQVPKNVSSDKFLFQNQVPKNVSSDPSIIKEKLFYQYFVWHNLF